MKKVNSSIFIILISVVSFISCDDVFENDISDTTLILNTPEDDAIIEADSLIFAWEYIDNADDYRFQLRDEESNIILIDSILTSNSIDLPIEPSIYSWRVQAKNFGYETAFTFPRDLTVLLPNDLSEVEVVLTSPLEGSYFNGGPLTLLWGSLEYADTYSVNISKLQNDANVELLSETELQENTFLIEPVTIEDEGEYLWSVKGVNDVSESILASSVFFIDNTVPNIPIIVGPENEITSAVGEVILFNWVLPVDDGVVQSPVRTILEVSNTATFESLLINEMTDDQTYSYQITDGFDELWWRIRLIDEAGNQGENSMERKIIIE